MGYVFSAPYFLHLALFFGYPLLFALILVFHRWDIVTPMEFIGLRNISRLLQDDLFFRAIRNTGFFLVIHIPLQIIVGLAEDMPAFGVSYEHPAAATGQQHTR